MVSSLIFWLIWCLYYLPIIFLIVNFFKINIITNYCHSIHIFFIFFLLLNMFYKKPLPKIDCWLYCFPYFKTHEFETIVLTWHFFNPRFFTFFSKSKIFIKTIRMRTDKACYLKQYNINFPRLNNFVKLISKNASLILEFLDLINQLFSLVLFIIYCFMFNEKQRIYSIPTKDIMHNPYCKGNKGTK